MKKKCSLGVMTLALWLIGTTGFAQLSNQPTYSSMSPMALPGDAQLYPPPAPMAKNAAPNVAAPVAGSSPGGLSDWILYRRDCCEGAHARVCPLYTELYLQAGPSIPVGTVLSRELKEGWSIAGGARALFFNEHHTAAWVVDAHIINTHESGGGGENKQFPITFFHNGIRSDLVVFEGVAGRKTFSINDTNRTMVGLGFGRDWYLSAPADAEGPKWRVGVDGGGRYGSQRLNFSEFGHVTDVIAGIYAGGHADVEVCWHGLIYHAGVRCEWAYTWSDILQTTSDIQDINVFATVGIRY